jgi:hypothetical protein
LMMLFLSRSDPLVPQFPPFMLNVCEVVNSPAESPECVCTQIRQESEAPVQNKRNRTIQFQKSDPSVLSRPTAVEGAIGLRRGAPPSTKRRLNGGEA